MLTQVIETILPVIIDVCELMGIIVVAISAAGAFWHYLKNLIFHRRDDVKFALANGLALSLEFKMAAEILKTVLVRDKEELIVLGAVILPVSYTHLNGRLVHFHRHESDGLDERRSVRRVGARPV